MTPKDLKEMIENIIEQKGDDEIAHSMEDALHRMIINEFCPDWVKLEVDRLSKVEFSRWCA